MKKKLLTILPLLLLSAILVNAQIVTPDVTTYRGAFAPSPERMWTESWANWDPQSTVYPATTITKSGTISANETWTSGNVYLLSGVVYIDSLITLTIEPGTIIRGDFATANSSLVAQRGAKLIAEGTACNPIVFTSNRDAGQRLSGDWGGVILLGRARNNKAANVVIEGLSTAEIRNYHGGTDDNDNSGSLKYVRIEYPGYVFTSNNEINGLTFGSVGRLTKVDYVQVSFSNDDSFEWFAGSVNAKHLVAYRGLDDDFDTDNGFSGTVQYALGVKDPDISDWPNGCPAAPACSSSEGFESDNDDPGTNETLVPKTSGKFYNVTQIGAFRCASNTAASGVTPTAPNQGFIRGARLRRNTDLKIYNSILMNNWKGLRLDGALAQGNVDQDSLVFRNNIIAGDFTTTWAGTGPYIGTKSIAAEDAATRTRLFNVAYSNDSVNTCSLLTNAWDFLNPDYRPNSAGDGAIVTNTNINKGPNLSLFAEIDNSLFTPSQAQDFVVNVKENNSGTTNGIITVTISKPSGWLITVPSITLTGTNQSGVSGSSNVNGGTANTNTNWNFRETATQVIASSKPGTLIGKNAQVTLGFNAQRRPATSTGTNQGMGITVAGGSDTTPLNNATLVSLSTSN